MGDAVRRRGWPFWLGLACLAAGVALLGWVAWQYWGTSWVSRRTHDRLAEQVEKAWEQGDDSVKTDEGVVGALVRIPEFGDDYAIPLLEGTSDTELAAGFGHLEDTAKPGAVGNFAIAGHRVTHGEPLRDMPSLEPGDEIIIETRTRIYTYVLTTGGDDLRVPFTAGWVLDPLPDNPEAGGAQPDQQPGQRLLTLTTCAELFHTDDRLVAFGVLDHTRRR